MHLIQPILLLGFLVTLFLYLRFLRSSLWDRLIGLGLFLIGCVAVVVPDSTNRVARLVGVGRGTDLTFYVFAVGSLFFGVLMYAKLNRLGREMTEVVRRLAIAEAMSYGPARRDSPAASEHDA